MFTPVRELAIQRQSALASNRIPKALMCVAALSAAFALSGCNGDALKNAARASSNLSRAAPSSSLNDAYEGLAVADPLSAQAPQAAITTTNAAAPLTDQQIDVATMLNHK